MAAPRRNKRLLSHELLEIVQCDDDSDIADDVEDQIEEVVADMQELFGSHDNVEEPPEHEIVIKPEDEPQEHLVPRGMRARRRARASSTRKGRSRSSASNRYREIDEENGWTYTTREVQPNLPMFESRTGVNVPVDQSSSEYDCLQLFFTPDFWKLLKVETNRYAGDMKLLLDRKGELKPGSMLACWKPVTIAELKRFFSIIIHMTLVKKESIDSYWSITPILHTAYPSQVMNRDRFRAIFNCLHLNDNNFYVPRGNPNYDAFFKLRPYFDDLCRQCESFYLPGECLTIDEGTCGFRGRIRFKVYNKDKPDKYGMKIYMLCDAETGYVLRMLPYIGDSKTTEQIVTSLLEPYYGKWHTCYMDRFFTNPTIFENLLVNGTRAVGEVMLNRRGLPQEWRNQSLEVNEMSFCHKENLTACKWKDKRDVCILTTKHAATWTEVEVKSKTGKVKRIKPDCILDYNLNKIGVNVNDQYMSHYSLDRKSMKWWKKMFFHLVSRSFVNAYIIYYKTHETKRRKGFGQFLAQAGQDVGLDGGLEEQESSSGPHTNGSLIRLTGRHFPEKIPPSEKKQVRARVCKVCADKTKHETGKRGRKETVWYCPDCNVPLCVDYCFKIYHTKKDYTA